MTITYSDEGVFTMASTITPTSGSAFKYNFSRSFDGRPDEIKVGLFADHATLTTTRYPESSYHVMANGSSVHYNFTELNTKKNNWDGFILDVENASGTRVIGVRQDYYELENSEDHWAGLSGMDWNWDTIDFPAVMNGATIDMTLTFNDGTFTMASTFNGSDGNTYHLNYTRDLGSTDPIAVYLEEDWSKLTMNTSTYTRANITSLPATFNLNNSLGSIDPFDNGSIANGSNIKAFKAYNETATAYFDSNTSSAGYQPYTLEDNEQVVISFIQYNGYHGSKDQTSTFSIKNSNDDDLISYTYNANGTSVTSLVIGDAAPDDFESFGCQSNNANGFSGNGRPYSAADNNNTKVTITIAKDGTVSINFYGSAKGINKTFTKKLTGVTMDLAKLVITGAGSDADRVSGYVKLNIKSQLQYSVVAKKGTETIKTLESGAFDRTDGSKTLYWSKYIENDGQWYEASEATYGKTITESGVVEVGYTESDIDYFVEAESWKASRTYDSITGNTKYSGGNGPGLYEKATLTSLSDIELEAGSYTMTIRSVTRNTNKSQNYNITYSVDGGTSWTDPSKTLAVTTAGTAGNSVETSVESLTLPASSRIRLTESNGNNAQDFLDYITLTKTKVDYTLKYVDGDGTELITVTKQAKWGSTITIAEADKNITVDDGAWGYVSDNSEGMTVAADGSTVVTITMTTPCADPTYEISGVVGSQRKFTLATATEDATLYYSTTEKAAGADGWTEYTDEVTTEATNIWAYAAKSGSANSAVITFATGAGEAIALNVPVISCTANNTVTITANATNVLGNPANTLYYRLGESGEFIAYTDPLTVSTATTVYAYAGATGYDNSSTVSREIGFVENSLPQKESLDRIAARGSLDETAGQTGTKATYYPLIVNENQWGSNVYFQQKDADKGGWSFAADKWYSNSAGSLYGFVMFKDLKAGDVVMFALSDSPDTPVNATYSEKYSYNGHYAYVATADGNVEIRVPRTSSKENNILTNISQYTTTVSATVSSAGYATYVPSYDLDFSETSIKAYKAQVNTTSGVITLTQVNNVPAGTPVVLYKDGGATENIPVMTGAAAAVSGNDLVAGTGVAVATDNGDGKYNYVLDNNDGIGFYKANGVVVATNRAYLQTTYNVAANKARALRIVFDGITGVANVEAAAEAKAQDGKFIENGKLVIVKNGQKFNAAGQQVK